MSQTFEIGVAEKIGYYVYLLIDPRTSEVFYVGKGVGDRCFAHVQVARRTKAGVIGDYPKLDRIREIEAAGQEVRLDILRHGLEEETAFHVEAATIDALRLDARDMGLLTNVVAGRDAEQGRQSVADINALYTAPPVEIAPEHKAVLIRINNEWYRGISPERLYAVTRASWVIGANRRALGGPRAPDYAFGVYRGVVRAVYKIEAWTADPRPLQPGKPARWVFTGHPDTGLASDYLGRGRVRLPARPRDRQPLAEPNAIRQLLTSAAELEPGYLIAAKQLSNSLVRNPWAATVSSTGQR